MENPPTTTLTNLQSDHDLLTCLLDHIPDRVYFKDREGRFIRVSRAEAQFLGATTPGEVIGKTDFDFFVPELAKVTWADEQRVMSTGQPMIGKVERKLHLDGRTGWALVAKIPLNDHAGELLGTCGISKDITALKETEAALQGANADLASKKLHLEETLAQLQATHEQLHEAQQRLIDYAKIESLARLAVAVAHEVRNPLAILAMGISYLSKQPAVVEDKESAVMLQDMSAAIQRAEVVMSALMDGAADSGTTINLAEVPVAVQNAVDIMKKRV
ncbi:MAG: PAS domain-containing protein [Verrucomicrobiota bacterium]